MAATISLVILSWSLAIPISLAAQSISSTYVDIGTEDEDVGRNITRSLFVLRDPDHALDAESLLREPIAEQWQTATSDSFNFGFDHAAYWLTFELHNPEQVQVQRLLEIGHRVIDFVDVYVLDGSGSVMEYEAGDRRPASSLQVPSRAYLFPVTVGPDELIRVLIRISTHDGFHEVTTAKLWTESAFSAYEARSSVMDGLYFGIILSIMILNGFIFLFVKDRAQAFYALYLLSFGIWVCVFEGYFSFYLAPNDARYGNMLLPVWICLFTMFFLLTVGHYLNGKKYFPKITACIRVLCFILILLIPVAILDYFAFSIGVLNVVLLPLVFMISLSAPVIAMLQGYQPARFFFVAALSLVLGSVVWITANLGIINVGGFEDISMRLGSAMEIIFLSLGLAERVKLEDVRKFDAMARKHRLSEFLPRSVADLVNNERADLLLPRSCEVAALVMDLRGFTPFVETTPPEIIVEVLETFFETMGGVAEAHRGLVSHFEGDSMTVLFNVPIESPYPAKDACKAALEMQRAFKALREQWRWQGHDLNLGIGIDIGMAEAGVVSMAGRQQYLAVGEPCTVANLLCDVAEGGEIRISEAVRTRVQGSGHHFELRNEQATPHMEAGRVLVGVSTLLA